MREFCSFRPAPSLSLAVWMSARQVDTLYRSVTMLMFSEVILPFFIYLFIFTHFKGCE